MKALAVLVFCLGLLALLSWRAPDGERDRALAGAVALNFTLFRNEANRYALAHPTAGDVPQAALTLPTGFSPLRPWRARIEGERCYVHGPASEDEIGRVRELVRGSFAIGRATGGLLVPCSPGGTPITLPAWIAEGSVVSVISLN